MTSMSNGRKGDMVFSTDYLKNRTFFVRRQYIIAFFWNIFSDNRRKKTESKVVSISLLVI